MPTPYSSVDIFLLDLSARLGINYTDEQRKFMSDFTRPTISFSSPGTGKTKSAVGGLLTAELYHGIPGSSIYALSFTRMSTGELRYRHASDCARLGIKQTVNFQTLHSLCSSILKENHKLLGFDTLDVVGSVSIEVLSTMLANVAENYAIPIQTWQFRPLIKACRSLNSSLIFDRDHVETMFDFKMVKMPYDDFTILRRALYLYAKNTNTLQVDDILLYTLELLLTHPEVSEAFKKRCRILLVDEFQDLSLLQLRLISLLADNVIAIGDIKQQIYAFNGACQEIVDEYMHYFPNAVTINLTKSFRCAPSIVEYSKGIIHPNEMGEEEFTSMRSEPGSVATVQDMMLGDLCASIEQEYRDNNNTFTRDIMFLFRNNYSAIPIAEEFFKRKVPFRVNKYQAANTIPVIRELCSIIELAANPNSPHNLEALRYILPELKDYRNIQDSPLYKIMCKEGCPLFEVSYKFRDAQAAARAMDVMLKVRDMLTNNRPMRELMNVIFPLFQTVYLQHKEAFLDMPSSYYMKQVHSLVQTKTYYQFVQDEAAKTQVIDDANARRQGIRCYTFHASKGLEAEDVYLLDCDRTVVPNMRQLDELDKYGCRLEKARDIRNERSLLFVAATRAKNRLFITYRGDISPLLQPYNEFQAYDNLYRDTKKRYEDAEEFERFIVFQPRPIPR